MNMKRMNEIIAGLNITKGTTMTTLRTLPFYNILPDQYKEFLKFSSGGEGFFGENYLIMWKAEELASLNKLHSMINENYPNIILFGTDGGGGGYGFDTSLKDSPIIKIDLIDIENQSLIAKDIYGFFEYLRNHHVD